MSNNEYTFEVKPITGGCDDYYQWGINCKYLMVNKLYKYTVDTVNSIVNTAITGYNATAEDIDTFWAGYNRFP